MEQYFKQWKRQEIELNYWVSAYSFDTMKQPMITFVFSQPIKKARPLSTLK